MTPGGLQSHNIIPTKILGTNLMAAPLMGTVFTIMYFAVCGLYIAWELKRAQKVEWKRNSLPPVDESENESGHENAPSMVASVVPILAGILLINFANLKPIYGLGLSVILCIILFYRHIEKGKMISTLNEGFSNGVMPLIMVTVVVGIAQVVAQTDAFDVIKSQLLTFSSTSKVCNSIFSCWHYQYYGFNLRFSLRRYCHDARNV